MKLLGGPTQQTYANLCVTAMLATVGVAAVLLLPSNQSQLGTQNAALTAQQKPTMTPSTRRLIASFGSTQLAALGIRIRVRDTAALESSIMHHYAGVNVHADPHRPIPNVFVDHLPGDFAQVMPVDKRKQLFVQSVLPLVLLVNAKIEAIRGRLQSLAAQQTLSADDQVWIMALQERYGLSRGVAHSGAVRPDAAKKLLLHIDIIPVSLALSQAAAESGWGRSRFARQGNALFGQWTEDGERGLLPLNRDQDKRHFVRAFPNLLASVDSYMRNLNSHPAYHDFRVARAGARQRNLPLNSLFLVGYLSAYSERGHVYIEELRTIIRVNKFSALDNSRLRNQTAI